MDLTTILLYIILFFVVRFVVVSVVRAHRQQKEEIRQSAIKYLNSIIHKVTIERYHGIEYWFDEDSNKFLAQGKTFEEISEILKSRFPDHVFLIDEGGVSNKTNWKFLPFDGRDSVGFVNRLIHGRTQ